MDIGDWRVKIDELDQQLVKLLNERCRCAVEIGKLKREKQLPVYEPERELAVFERVAQANHGPLTDQAVRHIFERIIDEMRAVQRVEIIEKHGAGAQHS